MYEISDIILQVYGLSLKNKMYTMKICIRQCDWTRFFMMQVLYAHCVAVQPAADKFILWAALAVFIPSAHLSALTRCICLQGIVI